MFARLHLPTQILLNLLAVTRVMHRIHRHQTIFKVASHLVEKFSDELLSMESEMGRMSIVMLPFLAHGHISPFFELAKQLAKRNINIFICSTPINLNSIKNRLSESSVSSRIQLVDLHLPSSPDLPSHYHTTNGLAPHLMTTLLNSFEMAGPNFTDILKNIKPDLVIYDFQPSWPAEIASSLNIPAVYFLTTAAATGSLGLHFFRSPDKEYPFPEIRAPSSERTKLSADQIKIFHNFVACFERSCDIILVKSFRELEGKYMDLMSVLAQKNMIPVGPLVQDSTLSHEDENIRNMMNWLDRKDRFSVVFVCFGSENYLSGEELEEMANALESTKCNFMWAVRFPSEEEKGCLPEGFIERVGDKGFVLEGWAPQTTILGHSGTGGFVSHCGWSSVTESMKYGVPIIGMPMKNDQPTNAKLVVEIGVGMEVARVNAGKFKREEIADVISKVLVEESGEDVRRKARELSLKIKDKGDEDLDRATEELLQICKKKKELW